MRYSELAEMRINARDALPAVVGHGYTKAAGLYNIEPNILMQIVPLEMIQKVIHVPLTLSGDRIVPVWTTPDSYFRSLNQYSDDAIEVNLDGHGIGPYEKVHSMTITKAAHQDEPDAEGYALIVTLTDGEVADWGRGQLMEKLKAKAEAEFTRTLMRLIARV